MPDGLLLRWMKKKEEELRLDLCGSVSACNTAKGDDVGVCVAAQTVVAVDAAGHLTGCVQTGNDAALGVQNMGIGVDLDTAHGVVHGGVRRLA